MLVLVSWYGFGHSKKREDEQDPPIPEVDPLTKLQLTPSQRALGKYLFTVLALFLLQVNLGAIVAHYTVEVKNSMVLISLNTYLIH